MQRLFLLLNLLAAFPMAHATELVVDQKNAAASDHNPGSAEAPLKTITAAASRVRPGDRVVIHGGDYRETVIITASGTKDAPIVFEAAPSEKPVIKGSDTVTGWTHDDGTVWKAKLQHYPPREGTSSDQAFFNTNDVREVFVRDGELLDAQRLGRVQSRNLLRAGTFFCDPTASVLYVWLANSGSPTDYRIEAAVRAAWLNIVGSHIVMRGIQMRHASTTSITNAAACSVEGDGDTMENCAITWGDFVGVSMGGRSNSLRNCVIACNGDSGVGGTGEHHTIEGCRVVYNNVDRYDPEGHAGGAKLIPRFSHSTIRHNEFAHNLGPGLWLDGACDDNIIDGNLCHDNEGPGIMVEISKGNLVMNNICYANRNNLDGPYRNEKGAITEKTLSERRIAPWRLLKLYHAGDGRGIYISSAPSTKLLYNTCYLNEAEGVCVEGPPRGSGPETMTTTDETVANNISVFNKGSQLTLHISQGDERPAESDHNLLFAVGAVFAKYGWGGPVAMSMPEWQKISGQDAHSFDADPHFAMAAMDDFRVFQNSPALGAGTAILGDNHDFFGNPRGREKTTIGACEAAACDYPQPAFEELSAIIGPNVR
ncbi:MAG: right-handed parallel beta-helix repeat-containing protein [Chthoniobacterales bacterium]